MRGLRESISNLTVIYPLFGSGRKRDGTSDKPIRQHTTHGSFNIPTHSDWIRRCAEVHPVQRSQSTPWFAPAYLQTCRYFYDEPFFPILQLNINFWVTFRVTAPRDALLCHAKFSETFAARYLAILDTDFIYVEILSEILKIFQIKRREIFRTFVAHSIMSKPGNLPYIFASPLFIQVNNTPFNIGFNVTCVYVLYIHITAHMVIICTFAILKFHPAIIYCIYLHYLSILHNKCFVYNNISKYIDLIYY